MTDTTSGLPLEVLGLFRIIFKSASRHFEEIEKSVGVTGAQLWALSEVANAPGLTVSHLAKSMSLHQSTTSNLIDKLESRGLIERVRSDTDRRVVAVWLTNEGKSILNAAPGPFRGMLPDALIRMREEDLLALKVNLTSLVSMLERKSDQAASEPLGTPIHLKI
jgi:DNA-binding MarR family transcriptional regulator